MLTGYGLRMSCSLLVEHALQADDAAHDLVGRRLVHAALDVGARVDAERRGRSAGSGTSAARSATSPGTGRGIEQPRVVERGVLGVELLALGLHVGDACRPAARARRARRSGSASARSGRSAPAGAAALGPAGHGDDADLLDVPQRLEPGAVLGVGGVERRCRSRRSAAASASSPPLSACRAAPGRPAGQQVDQRPRGRGGRASRPPRSALGRATRMYQRARPRAAGR